MRGVSMKRFGSGRKSDRFGMLGGRRQPGLESGWRQSFDSFAFKLHLALSLHVFGEWQKIQLFGYLSLIPPLGGLSIG